MYSKEYDNNLKICKIHHKRKEDLNDRVKLLASVEIVNKKIFRKISNLTLTVLIVGLSITTSSGMSEDINTVQEESLQYTKGVVEQSNYQLVWREEFDGTGLNTKFWIPRTTNAYWSYDPANVAVSNGNLVLTAANQNGQIKYGGVVTKDKYYFQNGYIEIRAKVVKGKGFLSGIWLTGQYNYPPEVDILEHLGKEPNAIYMTRHCSVNNDPTCDGWQYYPDYRPWWRTRSKRYIESDWSLGYHTYGVEWTPKYVRWIVDGVERFNVTTGAPKEPMWITLSLCANNCAGGWSGPSDSTTIFPSRMYVDYVRVYQKGGYSPGITVASPNGGENLIKGAGKIIKWNYGSNVGPYVKIELLKSGILNSVISPGTYNDGSYSWQIPYSQNVGNDYKVKISSTNNIVHTDTSDSYFKISVPTSITVASPNGGEGWQRGTAKTISWSSSGSPGTYVKIELYKGGVFNKIINSWTPNDGSYSWYIPYIQTIGGDYKIKITSTSNSVYNDWSNNYFKIY